MDDAAKQALTLQALGLLNEQIQARIVHYKGDLETSPELDAVTAQVVQQLKAMQAAISTEPSARESPEAMERKQIEILARLLTRVFNPGETSTIVNESMKKIGKRLAKLFFESELHEKTKGDKEKTIRHAEQGMYYVLQRYKNRLRAELEGFEYVDDSIRQMTLDLLAKTERDMQVAFLSRRSPELNKVMIIFTQVLMDFFKKHLPGRVDQMAKVVVRSAKTAHQKDSVGYKIHADTFPAFRAEWERLLMQQMVNYCGDELMARIEQTNEEFYEETIKFFLDPHIFSATCEVLCDSLYDYLCLEGLLDLPVDWQVTMGRE